MTWCDRIELAIILVLLFALAIVIAALVEKKEKHRPYCSRVKRCKKKHFTPIIGDKKGSVK